MATTVDHPPRTDLLLARRSARIEDELDRAGADGWLVYDFRGSNPDFARLLGTPQHSTRGAFLFIPPSGALRPPPGPPPAPSPAPLPLHPPLGRPPTADPPRRRGQLRSTRPRRPPLR